MSASAIDPATSLAFAIYAQPAVYAILIGSGISRAANIPTGSELTQQLVQELAATIPESKFESAEDWYRTHFQKELTFSSLLQELGPQRSDRAALLAKIVAGGANQAPSPTKAHLALARLAKDGWIKVFLTTNFDNLLETALDQLQITYSLVYNDAQARGLQPFQHCNVVVFKLHGDYLHPESILATKADLSKYKSNTNRLLRKLLEEYGLIACGWSAQGDPALKDAIAATRSRRYPMYITTHGKIDVETKETIDSRSATEISIVDADAFFGELVNSVEAIDSGRRSHPVHEAAMIARAKDLMDSSVVPSVLDDFMRKEVEKVCEAIAERDKDARATTLSEDSFVSLANSYIEHILPLARVFSYGCAWSGTEHYGVWTRNFERIRTRPISNIHLYTKPSLIYLPQLILLFAGSLSAVNRDKFDLLRALAIDLIQYNYLAYGNISIIGTFSTHSPYDYYQAQLLTNHFQNTTGRLYKTPESTFLYYLLREPLREIVASPLDYERTFNRTEILLSLLSIDASRQVRPEGIFWTDGPSGGRFAWDDPNGDWYEQHVRQEYETEEHHWAPLRAGLFAGDTDRVDKAFEILTREVAPLRNRYIVQKSLYDASK